jgi:protoporphyrinogen oxidase
MIEHTEIEGRPAIITYFKAGMQPAASVDEATMAKIIFEDDRSQRWVRFRSPPRAEESEDEAPFRVAIVGGGPGGLLTARFLERAGHSPTLFEASERLGGKVLTGRFDKAPVHYEAGVAEFYDYSHVGQDPLKELVTELGLSIQPIQSRTVLMDGHILSSDDDIAHIYGPGTLQAIDAFYDRCRQQLTPREFYEWDRRAENAHPWSQVTFKQILDQIPDETARKYVLTAVASDLAAEPDQTNAFFGLENVLMDDPDYLRLYTIVGGNERLIQRLTRDLRTTRIEPNTIVTRIDRNADGSLRLFTAAPDDASVSRSYDFDQVVLALPNYWLERIEWGDRQLRMAMEEHLHHYAHPAHYLRIAVLFETPLWRNMLPNDFWRSDDFGGCCVYDERNHLPSEPHGVLNWLIAGNAAMELGNLDDDQLVEMAIGNLAADIAETMIDAKVHRWIGTVNALPGGHPVPSLERRHMPAPGLILVGDYLFDTTLNGVLASADYATRLIARQRGALAT